jgi:hypothetical protein
LIAKLKADIPLQVEFGVGALKSIEIGKTSFDLAKANGYPELRNIKRHHIARASGWLQS